MLARTMTMSMWSPTRTVITRGRRRRTTMTLGVNVGVLDADVQVICHRTFEAAANVPPTVSVRILKTYSTMKAKLVG